MIGVPAFTTHDVVPADLRKSFGHRNKMLTSFTAGVPTEVSSLRAYGMIAATTSVQAVRTSPFNRGDRREAMRDVSAKAANTTVLVGDVHGMNFKLTRLFANLERKLGRDRFNGTRVVFLGDLCDRGPDTSKALGFIVDLPSRYPQMQVHVLAGNHDLAFATFLRAASSRVSDVPGRFTDE